MTEFLSTPKWPNPKSKDSQVLDLTATNFPSINSIACIKSKVHESYYDQDRVKNTTSKSFNNLPSELILEIIEFLQGNTSKDRGRLRIDRLLSLSLTNRRLNCIVTDYLYKSYDSSTGSPYLFLRTLIEQRNLAAKVRSLYWSYDITEFDRRESYQLTPNDRRIIKAGLKSQEIPHWKNVATACNNSDHSKQILFATALMHTPNIEHLEAYDGSLPYKVRRWLQPIQYAVNGNHFGRVHRFQNLRSVKIILNSMRLADLISIFRLPSLREVRLKRAVETGLLFSWNIPRAAFTVEILELDESFVDHEVLAGLVESCQYLKRFYYNHTDDWWDDRDNGWPILHYPSLVSALHRHHRSLEYLEVKEIDFDSTISANATIQSLRDFEAIKELRLPISAFIDVEFGRCQGFTEILPPLLRYLRLTIKSDEKVSHCKPSLNNLANLCQTHLPFLQGIDLKILHKADNFVLNWARWKKRFYQTGVILTHSYIDDEDSTLFGESDEASSSDESSDSSESVTESEEETENDSGSENES